ncbi:MAG: acyl-CoA dehydrogenase family protein, partial [Sphingomonadaceae bacterium]
MATQPAAQPARTFDWRDPLDRDARLTDEERMIRDAARAYARERLLPRVVAAYRDESFDPAIMRELGELGFLGATLPETYGCANVSHVAYGLIAREIEAVDSGYRSAMSVQSSLAMYPIFAFGSEEQRRRFLPGMARGEIIGCFGLTEAEGGSDPASMKTRAEKVAGGFRLNGGKYWITNSPIADIAVVWAKLEGEVRGFIVERGFEGFTTARIGDKLSLRASITGDIGLSDVVVPEANLLPGVK